MPGLQPSTLKIGKDTSENSPNFPTNSAKESFVSESSRWRVKLSTGDMKDLKAENLRVLDLKESQASSFAVGFLSHGI